MQSSTASANPLAAVSNVVPQRAAWLASIAGRLLGAALALAVALDQSYDPTQVFTVAIAAAVVATLVPLRGSLPGVAAGFGAGLVFFAGAVLNHMPAGVAMLIVGVVAGAAAAAFSHRAGRDATLPAVAFVAAVFASGALQVGIVFGFE